MHKESIFIICLICLTVLIVLPICGLAGPVGITVFPIKYKIEADPGQIINKTFTVVNPNDFELSVKAEFQDFKVDKNNNIQWLPADIENPYKMSDWIDISQEVITLKPKEKKSLPLTITVPADARPGGHYAAVFFTGLLEQKGTVGAVPRVGSLIIMNISGDLIKTGEFLDFCGPIFIDKGPVNFTLTFLNTGTTHYEVKANIEIKKILGPKKTIFSEPNFVYPDIERKLKAQWNEKRPFGIYKATAKIIDGEGNEHILSKTFVAFPWKISLVILVILIILYFAYRRFKKNFKLVKVK